mmetsp:Transcript_24426/g.61393  ORF Transcript_24426/g.61393 Transcript_24426/m.61393 type:complete len:294 (+) Transcript_24426:136-1017(+)|eukprot:CAMPEP_0178984822 /NCGR_PEP_ID=MMETSP0795-20121207/1823_1 /TAXON_ID=88552 /ORGANISM="Amoebophrya sp., Strain Ameob2" /LENGTH=293 /DNA_ID=CAMNT_0020675737 /DNA_START=122 /DNA_END=1003 /DNA_ORIENTATION=-
MSSFTESKQGLPGTDLLRAGLYHKIKLMTEGHPRLLMKGGKNILGMSKMQLTTFITQTARKAHSEMSAGHEDDAMDVMLEVCAAVHQFAHPGFVDDLGLGPSQRQLGRLLEERGTRLAGVLKEEKLIKEIEEEWDESTIRGTKSEPAEKDWVPVPPARDLIADALGGSPLSSPSPSEVGIDTEDHLMQLRAKENSTLLKRIISEPRPERYLEGRVRLQVEENNALLKRVINILEAPDQHHHPLMSFNKELDKRNILRAIFETFEEVPHGVENAVRIGMAKSRDDARREGDRLG